MDLRCRLGSHIWTVTPELLYLQVRVPPEEDTHDEKVDGVTIRQRPLERCNRPDCGLLRWLGPLPPGGE